MACVQFSPISKERQSYLLCWDERSTQQCARISVTCGRHKHSKAGPQSGFYDHCCTLQSFIHRILPGLFYCCSLTPALCRAVAWVGMAMASLTPLATRPRALLGAPLRQARCIKIIDLHSILVPMRARGCTIYQLRCWPPSGTQVGVLRAAAPARRGGPAPQALFGGLFGGAKTDAAAGTVAPQYYICANCAANANSAAPCCRAQLNRLLLHQHFCIATPAEQASTAATSTLMVTSKRRLEATSALCAVRQRAASRCTRELSRASPTMRAAPCRHGSRLVNGDFCTHNVPARCHIGIVPQCCPASQSSGPNGCGWWAAEGPKQSSQRHYTTQLHSAGAS